MPFRRHVTTILLAAAALVAASTTQALAAPTRRSTSTPVIAVHGLAGGTCPSANSAALWAYLKYALTANHWTGAFVPVSYFACDTNGADITGYGATSSSMTPTVRASWPSSGYTLNGDIDDIARDLAWFVYADYTRRGQAVDIVGASFGGLIVRTALTRVAQHDPSFPPQLLVTDVVTMAAPMDGVSASVLATACPSGGNLCAQTVTDSAFLTSLDGATAPQGTGGTDWTLLGSACDMVPTSSSLDLSPAHQISYSSPCYAHAAYETDLSTALNAVVHYTDPGSPTKVSTTFPHALRLTFDALMSAKR
jgi:hypothetical protein